GQHEMAWEPGNELNILILMWLNGYAEPGRCNNLGVSEVHGLKKIARRKVVDFSPVVDQVQSRRDAVPESDARRRKRIVHSNNGSHSDLAPVHARIGLLPESAASPKCAGHKDEKSSHCQVWRHGPLLSTSKSHMALGAEYARGRSHHPGNTLSILGWSASIRPTTLCCSVIGSVNREEKTHADQVVVCRRRGTGGTRFCCLCRDCLVQSRPVGLSRSAAVGRRWEREC